MVGCKRGNLRNEIPGIKLCPSQFRDFKLQPNTGFPNTDQDVNLSSQRTIERRQNSLANAINVGPSFDTQPHYDINTFVLSLEPFHTYREPQCKAEQSLTRALLPLHECIFFIVWEGADCIVSRSLLAANHDNLNALSLLYSAANYQAQYESMSVFSVT